MHYPKTPSSRSMGWYLRDSLGKGASPSRWRALARPAAGLLASLGCVALMADPNVYLEQVAPGHEACPGEDVMFRCHVSQPVQGVEFRFESGDHSPGVLVTRDDPEVTGRNLLDVTLYNATFSLLPNNQTARAAFPASPALDGLQVGCFPCGNLDFGGCSRIGKNVTTLHTARSGAPDLQVSLWPGFASGWPDSGQYHIHANVTLAPREAGQNVTYTLTVKAVTDANGQPLMEGAGLNRNLTVSCGGKAESVEYSGLEPGQYRIHAASLDHPQCGGQQEVTGLLPDTLQWQDAYGSVQGSAIQLSWPHSDLETDYQLQYQWQEGGAAAALPVAWPATTLQVVLPGLFAGLGRVDLEWLGFQLAVNGRVLANATVGAQSLQASHLANNGTHIFWINPEPRVTPDSMAWVLYEPLQNGSRLLGSGNLPNKQAILPIALEPGSYKLTLQYIYGNAPVAGPLSQYNFTLPGPGTVSRPTPSPTDSVSSPPGSVFAVPPAAGVDCDDSLFAGGTGCWGIPEYAILVTGSVVTVAVSVGVTVVMGCLLYHRLTGKPIPMQAGDQVFYDFLKRHGETVRVSH